MGRVPPFHPLQVGLGSVCEDRGLIDHLKEAYPAASSLKLPLKQVKLFQTKNSMDKRKEDLTALLRAVVRCPELLNDKNTVVFLKQDYVSMKSMQ